MAVTQVYLSERGLGLTARSRGGVLSKNSLNPKGDVPNGMDGVADSMSGSHQKLEAPGAPRFMNALPE